MHAGKLAILLCSMVFSVAFGAEPAPPDAFPLKPNDVVLLNGSSSTSIGIWCRTFEFLMRTRHPDLKLAFKRAGFGGSTFAKNLPGLPALLEKHKPTVVILNFGGNDANSGEAGLAAFKDNIGKTVAAIQAAGARAIVMSHQPGDKRKAGEKAAANRTLYARTLLEHCREKNWLAVDTHTRLLNLQATAEKENPAFTINKDNIHLTTPAYVAWGLFLYAELKPPAAENSAELDATGKITAAQGCAIEDLKAADGGLKFTRKDAILPLLPPVELPPAASVPFEAHARYLLKVTRLAEGAYEILVEGQPLGEASAQELAAGINLNAVLLKSGKPAPWKTLADELWSGKGLEKIGQTAWVFELKKK